MTENLDYGFTTIDDDLLLAGSDGYLGGGGGGGDVFWSAKANSSYTFYFVTDFWTAREDHGWWNWREIFAAEGLAGGIELPGGLRGFAVRDQRVQNVDGRVYRQDIHPGEPDYDQLLGLVVPYLPKKTKATRPFRPVSDKVGLNVVEVVDGSLYHKVLVLTGARGQKLKRIITGYRELVDDFTCIGKQWVLTIDGQGAQETLELRQVKGAAPIELPEPYDIPALLQEKRDRILDLVQGATGVSTEGVDGPTYEEHPATPVSTGRKELDYYESMADNRLRSLLGKAGVPVKPKTPRDGEEGLLVLAVENQV